MEVLIFTEAGKEYGLGHIVRCTALYDELYARGITTRFVVNSDIPLEPLLRERQYINTKWYGRINEFIEDDCFSIIDSYHASINDYKTASEKCINSLYIDDVDRIQYPNGIIVNPGIGAEEIPYRKQKGQRYLLGSNYTILRSAFNDPKVTERIIKKNINDILVLLGGSDIRNLTPVIMECLNSDKFRYLNKHIIFGNGFQNASQIKELSTAGYFKLHYDADAMEVKSLMQTCDLAVTTAGQTVNELIAMRLPFICIKVADNQENNIKALMDRNIISSYFNCLQDNDKEYFSGWLQKQISIMEKYEERKAFSEKLCSFKLTNGAINIINELLGEKDA